jgi:hypothetical protein
VFPHSDGIDEAADEPRDGRLRRRDHSTAADFFSAKPQYRATQLSPAAADLEMASIARLSAVSIARF